LFFPFTEHKVKDPQFFLKGVALSLIEQGQGESQFLVLEVYFFVKGIDFPGLDQMAAPLKGDHEVVAGWKASYEHFVESEDGLVLFAISADALKEIHGK
jgi:hypothetical protein